MKAIPISATRLSLCIAATCLVGSAVAQERARDTATEVLSASVQDVSGTWVTNQGLLELAQTGDQLTGSLDGTTKVSGNATDTISLQYKRNAFPVYVTLRIGESGRWISGATKKGTKWFGCRSKVPENDAREPMAEFSGHWLVSWGIMRLTQTADQVQGSYGADRFGKIQGAVVGPRLKFQWTRHRGKGTAWIEQSPSTLR